MRYVIDTETGNVVLKDSEHVFRFKGDTVTLEDGLIYQNKCTVIDSEVEDAETLAEIQQKEIELRDKIEDTKQKAILKLNGNMLDLFVDLVLSNNLKLSDELDELLTNASSKYFSFKSKKDEKSKKNF